MMTKLSDTQHVILSKSAQHEALLATPPAKLPADARQSVLRSLIAKALLEEVPAPGAAGASAEYTQRTHPDRQRSVDSYDRREDPGANRPDGGCHAPIVIRREEWQRTSTAVHR